MSRWTLRIPGHGARTTVTITAPSYANHRSVSSNQVQGFYHTKVKCSWLVMCILRKSCLRSQKLDPCLGIFQLKSYSVFRDVLQKSDPSARHIPVYHIYVSRRQVLNVTTFANEIGGFIWKQPREMQNALIYVQTCLKNQ